MHHESLVNYYNFIAALTTEDKLEYNFYPVSGSQIQFRVKGPNDAHVALTTGPNESDPMWEVCKWTLNVLHLNNTIKTKYFFISLIEKSAVWAINVIIVQFSILLGLPRWLEEHQIGHPQEQDETRRNRSRHPRYSV